MHEIRVAVTTVHSCKPCTEVQRDQSKLSHRINILCSSVFSTPSFSSFVLTRTAAIAVADTWLVKACCDLLNHRFHKNVKGIIQLLGVIKHTSDRLGENTQTSHREKITDQKSLTKRQWDASWRALQNIALEASIGLCRSWYRVLPCDPVIMLGLHLNDSPFQQGEMDPCCLGQFKMKYRSLSWV